MLHGQAAAVRLPGPGTPGQAGQGLRCTARARRSCHRPSSASLRLWVAAAMCMVTATLAITALCQAAACLPQVCFWTAHLPLYQ